MVDVATLQPGGAGHRRHPRRRGDHHGGRPRADQPDRPRSTRSRPPTRPPWSAPTRPTRRCVPLPLPFLSRHLRRGHAGRRRDRPGSVLNPANYTLTGATGGAHGGRSPSVYDAATPHRLLLVRRAAARHLHADGRHRGDSSGRHRICRRPTSPASRRWATSPALHRASPSPTRATTAPRQRLLRPDAHQHQRRGRCTCRRCWCSTRCSGTTGLPLGHRGPDR